MMQLGKAPVFGFLLLLLIPLCPARDQAGKSVLLGSGDSLYAQTPKYPYRKLDNRKEGIVKSKQLVGGERLVLVSAAIENDEAMPEENAAEYNLAFYLEDTSRMTVVVREFEKLYKMEPLKREYPSGLCRFSWPSEIPRYYGIGLQDLSPLAKVSGSGGRRIVPVVLFYAKPEIQNPSYRFCFVPHHSVSKLEYKIYQSSSLEPIYTGELSDLRADKEACLRWPGKNQNNEIVTDGWYHLVVTVTFKPRPGTPPRRGTSKYQFYHYAGILKGNY